MLMDSDCTVGGGLLASLSAALALILKWGICEVVLGLNGGGLLKGHLLGTLKCVYLASGCLASIFLSSPNNILSDVWNLKYLIQHSYCRYSSFLFFFLSGRDYLFLDVTILASYHWNLPNLFQLLAISIYAVDAGIETNFSSLPPPSPNYFLYVMLLLNHWIWEKLYPMIFMILHFQNHLTWCGIPYIFGTSRVVGCPLTVEKGLI